MIECKSCTEVLDKHSSQLFRYFGTSSAKFGILTNGIIYKFYTDLDESNKMDLTPFLEFDMENINDSLIPSLKKFCKAELLIPDKSKNFERIYLESLNDIYKYKDKLIDAVKLYL